MTASTAIGSLDPPGLSTTGPLTILVVDDEAEIRRLVAIAVHAMGVLDTLFCDRPIRVLEAASGVDALELAASDYPELIILDIGLPDMSGLEVVRTIRMNATTPILVLSARSRDVEKAMLLDAGADDYLTKPFSEIELQARLRAILRRLHTAHSQAAPSAITRFGDVSFDPRLQQVQRNGQYVHLTPTELALLQVFLGQPNRALTHRELFRRVWGESAGDTAQYLRVYMGQLRRKLEHDAKRPRYLQTVPRVGYRLVPTGQLAR